MKPKMLNLHEVGAGACREFDWPKWDLLVTAPPFYSSVEAEAGDGKPDLVSCLGNLMMDMDHLMKFANPGAFIALVLSLEVADGAVWPMYTYVPLAMLDRFPQLTHYDQIVWHKPNIRTKRGLTFLQNPLTRRFRSNQQHEEIVVFRLSGGWNFKLLPLKGEVVNHRMGSSVWEIPCPTGKAAEAMGHRYAWPDELAFRLISLYNQKDGVVVDPYCGSGQALRWAQALGFPWVGSEILPEVAAWAAEWPYANPPELTPEQKEICQWLGTTRQ